MKASVMDVLIYFILVNKVTKLKSLLNRCDKKKVTESSEYLPYKYQYASTLMCDTVYD